MKNLSIVCLTTLLVVGSLAQPVEAGRRARRRAAVAVGVGAGVAVAAARRPVVVAAAAPVATRPAPAVVVAPDLTVTDIAAADDTHCITVKNIGNTISPITQLRIDFHRATDGVLVASKRIVVRRLHVDQSIVFRLHTIPTGHLHVTAHVDPYNRVSELNEENNQLSVEIVNHPPVVWEDVEMMDESSIPAPENNETANQAP